MEIRALLLQCKKWIEETWLCKKIWGAWFWASSKLSQLHSMVLNALKIGCGVGGLYSTAAFLKNYSPICKEFFGSVYAKMCTPTGFGAILTGVAALTMFVSYISSTTHQYNQDILRNGFDDANIDMFMNVNGHVAG